MGFYTPYFLPPLSWWMGFILDVTPPLQLVDLFFVVDIRGIYVLS